jgi:uncharacterized protein YidB (DUF937 family)
MGQPNQPNQPNQPQAQAGGSGMNQVMRALLPVVLAMLANRAASGSQPRSGQATSNTGGGGLADVIGAVLGGSGGGGGGLGGLGSILGRLQQAGYGKQADSWVGRGQNQPLPPDAMAQVFGNGGLAEIARRAGVSEADASRGLSELLPEVVDHVTPDGSVPDLDSLAASVDALTQRSRMR